MCDCYIKVDTTIPTNSKPKPFLLLLFQSVKASKARKKIVFIKKASNNAPKTDKKKFFLGKLQHSNDYHEGFNQFLFQISIQTSSTKRMKKLKKH